jgi:hypothetical protein
MRIESIFFHIKNMKNLLFNMESVITGSYKAIVGAGAGAGAETNSSGSTTLQAGCLYLGVTLYCTPRAAESAFISELELSDWPGIITS